MDFLDIFCYGHQAGHGAERLSLVVCIQTGDDDADATVGQLLAYANYAVVKELGFINAHHFYVRIYLEHTGGRLDGGAGNAVVIMGNHVQVREALVYRGLEGGNLLLGKLRPFEPSDELLRFAGEHGAANYLNTAGFF